MACEFGYNSDDEFCQRYVLIKGCDERLKDNFFLEEKIRIKE